MKVKNPVGNDRKYSLFPKFPVWIIRANISIIFDNYQNYISFAGIYMNEFKEFQARDLDACIKEACTFFDCPREKLEVEIIQDAKSGIFGIVGARKAKIRARRAHIPEKMLDFLESQPQQRESAKNISKSKMIKPIAYENKKNGARPSRNSLSRNLPSAAKNETIKNSSAKRLFDNKKLSYAHAVELDREDLPDGKIDELNKEELLKLTGDTVNRLVRPIAGKDVNINAEIMHGLVHVHVEWEGDAGLLIGREGQTLASLQYIASRIISHAMNAGVRVQLEIGDYKSRQDEKLKERAHLLAEKVRQTGRSWATQPLSSYHRRIVHMELQEEPGIITRSIGEGIMKKVIIALKRPGDSA